MSVEITGVVKHSPSYKAKIKKGDVLISIDGNEIKDVLDYMFYAAESNLTLDLSRDNKKYTVKIIKSEYDDLGLEFNSFLMDDKKSCHNKCVFCFIDQMPCGMRDTLYFKDDDARLSFLHGNYVTLTNLKQDDIDRIIKMKLNINVSVHTTNPELRNIMMKNRFAGDKIDYLYQLANASIQMNCQIVLCPGINDGKELDRTLSDLGSIGENINSIAIVPVGLTKFREGLFELKPFDKDSSRKVIEQVSKFQENFFNKFGTRLVYLADEFFLKAELPIPESDYYESYPQYENGVGMLRYLIDGFSGYIKDNDNYNVYRNVSIATGVAAAETIKKLVEKLKEKWHNINCNVYTINNEFFGENITVAGLLTAQDIMKQLKERPLGEVLILSKDMIKKDSDLFLDDYTISDVEKELNVKIQLVDSDGIELLDAILGNEF